jgi:hypothetical protein
MLQARRRASRTTALGLQVAVGQMREAQKGFSRATGCARRGE